MKRFNKIRGIGGQVLNEEDFFVREILTRKFSAFKRGKHGVEKISGPFVVLKLTKRGMTTEEAIKKVASIYGIKKDIGFAGLKDKFAVTEQYITIKNFSGNNFCNKNMSVEKVRVSSHPIGAGDLEGNRFEITLHDCTHIKNLDALLISLKTEGMPNYFGEQRFGSHGDNHVIGRYLVKRMYTDALQIINRHERKVDNIKKIEKRRLKFFVNAYQSFIFNKMLDMYIARHRKPYYKDVPVVGSKTKIYHDIFSSIIKGIMQKEHITTRNFRIDDLKLSCDGSSRQAFVKLKIERIDIAGNTVRLTFTLPPGSYATVMLRELTG
ncbi:MAG: tRNA pseudouridine(13) synthase TruD [Candidatus Aenigmarchaeota archaeon]|nr:tRNA pseudouridine(13) synthase TruD [Candidatus Aenigmarchaeota archaeon]